MYTTRQQVLSTMICVTAFIIEKANCSLRDAVLQINFQPHLYWHWHEYSNGFSQSFFFVFVFLSNFLLCQDSSSCGDC